MASRPDRRLPTPMTEVLTVAKRDLKAGEVLDGGGGYTVSGICEKATVARAENLLPLGLSVGAVLNRMCPQARPSPMTWSTGRGLVCAATAPPADATVWE